MTKPPPSNSKSIGTRLKDLILLTQLVISSIFTTKPQVSKRTSQYLPPFTAKSALERTACSSRQPNSPNPTPPVHSSFICHIALHLPPKHQKKRKKEKKRSTASFFVKTSQVHQISLAAPPGCRKKSTAKSTPRLELDARERCYHAPSASGLMIFSIQE